MKKLLRGRYNEIDMGSLAAGTRKKICNLVDAASKAPHIDEHGTWEFGSEYDNAGRGEAMNWSPYGIGLDPHNRKFLAVIQIRQWRKTTRNGYPRIRKNYFLLGRKEDRSVFAHSIPARTVQYAARNERDVVRAAQDWIFQSDYAKVVRQGDLALIPVRRAGGDLLIESEMLLEENHLLRAEEIYNNGSAIYVRNPQLRHLPGTHPDIKETGLYKLVVGRRAPYWRFAAPTVD